MLGDRFSRNLHRPPKAALQLIWHEWTTSGFQTIEPGTDGILRSRCLPGLWLDHAAFWRHDLATVLAVLQQGLATPGHAAFVARLAGKNA